MAAQALKTADCRVTETEPEGELRCSVIHIEHRVTADKTS